MDSSKQLSDISAVYLEAVYGKSAGQELAQREKDDDAFGSPRKATPASGTGKYYKEGQPTKQQLAVRAKQEKIKAASNKGLQYKEELVVEKQKDTPDQVKAVIAFDKARKGTDDATYDSEHGDKKQAKKERDYAKWQRDKGTEDAQKSGHPWEKAKGSTREKEGKKSEKAAHIKDSVEPRYGKEMQGYADAIAQVFNEFNNPKGEPVQTQGTKGVLKKELKDLKKGALSLKDKDVKNADQVDTPNYKGQKFGVKENDEYVPSEMIVKLAESGKFSEEEIAKMVEIERLGK